MGQSIGESRDHRMKAVVGIILFGTLLSLTLGEDCADKYSNCADLKAYCNNKFNPQIKAGCRETCGVCVNTGVGYCRKSQHTMCKLKGPSQSCNMNMFFNGISSTGERILVDEHNKLRSKIALGKQPGQPSASNMNKVEWNAELAEISQRWADQCMFEHDKVRDKLDGTQVGQNLAISYSSGGGQPNQNDLEQKYLAGFVNSWYDEVVDPGFTFSNPFKFNYGAGHYTQVVWAKTTQIGCGAVAYKGGSWDVNYLLVCNYQFGNMNGVSMYKTGRACTACPAERSTCGSDGLCS